jgi:hypothetical protein
MCDGYSDGKIDGEAEQRMESSSIELPGSEIESISFKEGCLRVRFSRAYIVKTMTGSEERTRWWQAGELVMDGAQLDSDLPVGPLICDGGDVDDNVFTYRDMIPVPLDSRGRTGCKLRFRANPAVLSASAEALRLEMIDVPKYIEHIRPTA